MSVRVSSPPKPPSARGDQAARRRRTKLNSGKNIANDEFMAAAIGDVEWLRQSVRDIGTTMNYDKNGLTALHIAAIHGRIDCLKLLIEKHKLDINLPSTTGWKPIHLCISNQTGKRAFQCMEYLISKGADTSCFNEDNITPAHQAASEGHVQCLKNLIALGAKVDQPDCRGHTPLDLAKLWGHRRCARILAAELWHKNKHHVATEMNQLQRIKMQQFLREMDAEEGKMADQEFYGEIAFKEWLNRKNLDDKPIGPPSQQKGKPGQESEPVMDPNIETSKWSEKMRESLQKPNSIAVKNTNLQKVESRRKVVEPTPKVGKAMSSEQRKNTAKSRSSDGVGDRGLYEIPENDESDEGEIIQVDEGYYNPSRWNKSTKAALTTYLPNLTDDYPRDEYTLMPRTNSAPIYYNGKHRHFVRESDRKFSGVTSSSALRKPDLPQEIIKQELSKDPSMFQRPMVFKCQHIGDVMLKRKCPEEKAPKSEATLHLSNDVSSYMFKQSLRIKPICRSAPSSLSSQEPTMVSDWMSQRFPKNFLLGAMKEISKPDHFPNTKGKEYDINLGDFSCITVG